MVDMKTEEINGETETPQKSAKQLQKEAKKQAKLDKFKQKQEKKESDKAPKVKEKNEVRLLKSFTFTYFQLLSFILSIWPSFFCYAIRNLFVNKNVLFLFLIFKMFLLFRKLKRKRNAKNQLYTW